MSGVSWSSSSSSSLVTSSFRSCVLGWIVVVVVMGVVGRAGCLSLLLVKSLSVASHFELSSALVNQVMSLVRSLLSLMFQSGCK